MNGGIANFVPFLDGSFEQDNPEIWEDLKPFLDDIMKKTPNFKLGHITSEKLENSIDDLLFGIKNGSKRIEKTIEII